MEDPTQTRLYLLSKHIVILVLGLFEKDGFGPVKNKSKVYPDNSEQFGACEAKY